MVVIVDKEEDVKVPMSKDEKEKRKRHSVINITQHSSLFSILLANCIASEIFLIDI